MNQVYPRPEELNIAYKNMYANDFRYLKGIVRNTLMMEGPNNASYGSAARMQHILEVMKISKMILNLSMTKPLPIDHPISKIIHNKMEWSVQLVALMHDMYKMEETKVHSHGFLAAKQFGFYARMKGFDYTDNPAAPDPDNHLWFMYSAIINHSNHTAFSPETNIYYDILCDADILSKYTIENVIDKWKNKYNGEGTLKETVDKVLNTHTPYTGKTLPYEYLKDVYLDKLKIDVELKAYA